jgi:sterol desaturase/sphingolipid hydroxylase (fatty acid hydroxylase superfamily)
MTNYLQFGLLLAVQLLLNRHLSWIQLSLGLFSWTFLEYAFHRFAFHSHSNHRLMAPLNDGEHREHHKAPGNIRYITVPILFATVLNAAIFGLYYLLGGLSNAESYDSGIIIGYLVYECTHYMSHRLHPKFFLLKKLKRYHMEHHFMNEDTRFGVTSPMWDYFFNTMKNEEDEGL